MLPVFRMWMIYILIALIGFLQLVLAADQSQTGLTKQEPRQFSVDVRDLTFTFVNLSKYKDSFLFELCFLLQFLNGLPSLCEL